MLPQSLPDFDSLWDYNNPYQTETRFREILLQFPEDDQRFLELLTQIARARGLQRKFDQAHQTLQSPLSFGAWQSLQFVWETRRGASIL
jgi:hypothetical protein